MRSQWRSQQEASRICSIPFIISAVAVVPFGRLMDWTGGRTWYMLVGALSLIASFVSFGYTDADPMVGSAFLGLSYGVFPPGTIDARSPA